VTAFIALCVLMTVIAILMVARPLLRRVGEQSRPAINTAWMIGILIPAAAAAMYVGLSQWDWKNPDAAKAPVQPDVGAMVAKLEQKLQKDPSNLDGWLMLGRSYLTLQKAPEAEAAYQKAVDLGGVNHTEAALGLAQALVMRDESAIVGRAGDLFESVLKREPGDLTALWYGAVTALQRGNLPLGRERIKTMIDMNPPDRVRMVLLRQLQEIDQMTAQNSNPSAQPSTAQGANAPAQTQANAPTQAAASNQVSVKVSLSAKFQKGLDPRTPLFIMARNGAGPPLAVVRRAVGDLPLVVTLSDREAMIAGRSISSAKEFDIVARIAKSGAPQAQPGDLYGEVHHRLSSTGKDAVEIVIDRAVP
jgi:cytochrome c-type biogenesis protein CcmH